MTDTPEASSTEAPRPTRMTENERRIGMALAVLCLAFVAAPWLPKAISGDSKSAELCGLSSVLALALVLAVRRAHRVFATFAAVLAGFPSPRFVAAFAVQLGCLVYGGWLMLTTNRAVRAAAKADGRTPAQRAQARQQARAARRRPAETPSPTGRRPATASKRYTPPAKKKSR